MEKLVIDIVKSGHYEKYWKTSSKCDKEYKKLMNSQILLLDEIDYLKINKEGANLFFQLILKLDEKVAMILTTNKTFTEWREFLGDPALAIVVLDRLLGVKHLI